MSLNEQEKQEALEALQKRSEFEDTLVIKAYENEQFKQELLADPKSVYEQELGTSIPESFNIQVLEEQPNTIYLILPRKTEAAEVEGELSDEALDAVAGGAKTSWAIAGRDSWVVAWS